MKRMPRQLLVAITQQTIPTVVIRRVDTYSKDNLHTANPKQQQVTYSGLSFVK